MTVKDNIDTKVKEILGNHIVNNGFDLDTELNSLCHAICYMNTQLGFIKQLIPETEDKDYVETVRVNVLDILTRK